MRVLAIVNAWPSEDNPAYGIFIKEQIESLVREGVDVDVYFIDGKSSKFAYLSAIPHLRKKFRSGRFDLAHAHYGLSAACAAWAGIAPFVVSFMGDDLLGTPDARGNNTLKGKFVSHLSRRIAKRAAAVIVKSREMAGLLPRDDAAVIPNGVNFEAFRPMDEAEAKNKVMLKPETRYVLFANDPEIPVKRFPLAEAAVELAIRDHPEIELFTVAKAPHSYMPFYYNAAEVLLLTSSHEGSPNAVKEALACNMKVVSTDVGDVRELFADAAGLYLAEAAPENIAEKLGAALAFGRKTNARDGIGRLEMSNVAKQVIGVYEDALKKGTG